MSRINIIPIATGVGGMVSFQRRFTKGLSSLGIEVVQGFYESTADAVLITGGTRNLYGLLKAKRNGIRLVQRLNGMNWLHRKLKTGYRHYLRAEYGNLILRIIRRYFADHIIYQSKFAQDWWERVYSKTSTPTTVIYNGVDLDKFSPGSYTTFIERDQDWVENCLRPEDRFRIIMVEGSMAGGYEIGIDTAVGLISLLNSTYHKELLKPVELMVVGHVPEQQKTEWMKRVESDITWAGIVDSKIIPCLDNGAHLLFSADINAACPNAVIEALACGTPVIGFRTGALQEMVVDCAGEVVPYGGDPWQLEKPDIKRLARGAAEILLHQESYRVGARKRAEEAFGIDRMISGYLDVLLAG